MRIERALAWLVMVASSAGCRCDEARSSLGSEVPAEGQGSSSATSSTPTHPSPAAGLRTTPVVSVVRAYRLPGQSGISVAPDEVAIGIELLDASDGARQAHASVLDVDGRELANRDLEWAMLAEDGTVLERSPSFVVGEPAPPGPRRLLLVTAVPAALTGVRLRMYDELTDVVTLEGDRVAPPAPTMQVVERARVTLPGWGEAVVARVETRDLLPGETPDGVGLRDRVGDGPGATHYTIAASVETDEDGRPRASPGTTPHRTFAVALSADATDELWFDCGAEAPCEVPALAPTTSLPDETLVALGAR